MSLVTTPVRQLVRCSVCASTRVTAIQLTLTDGSQVDFASCHACENKTWTQGGREIEVGAVLDKARKPRR
jgi:hypothetical protein